MTRIQKETRVPEIARTLLGIGLLAGLLAGSVRAATPSAVPPPQDVATARSILTELVALDTTYEKGTRAAVEALRKRFVTAGFPTADLVVLARPGSPAQSNLIVKLKGHGRGKPLLYLCHLDVVAARPEDWTVPPFALTEKDGWLYGRGSQDMKGEDANVAAALLRLKREGYVPARDIIVAFTADEEDAGGEGVAWLVEAHRDLIDAAVVLNPDAGTAGFRDGRRAFYGVQTSEKIYLTFVAETVNKGGHSSEPRSDNAIYELTAALQRLAAFRFPVQLTKTTRGFFASQASLETGARQQTMQAVGKGDLNAAERLAENPIDNLRLRTTCVPTLLEAGDAENALPQRARATIQCRLLPVDTPENVQAQLERVFADPAVKLTVTVPAGPSPESPPTDAVMAIYTRVVHSMWPGLAVMPSMDAGASDSIYTRAAGMPSYGAISLFFDIEDYRAHGRDERIKVDRFVEGGEFAYRLMKAFSDAAAF